MKKYRQAALILAVLTLVLTAGITTAYASEYEYDENLSKKRTSVLSAFENNDYDSWKEIIHGSSISKIVTKERFEQFIKARNLARSGKYDESFELGLDLGFNLQKETKGKMMEFRFNNKAIEENIHLIERAQKLIYEGNSGEFDDENDSR